MILELEQMKKVPFKRGLRAKCNLLEDAWVNKNKEMENIIMGNFVKRTNKNNDYGTKNPEAGVKAPEVCAGTVEYKMSKLMADEIIKASKSKRSPQEILCDYVNTQCGLKGYCVKVLVEL